MTPTAGNVFVALDSDVWDVRERAFRALFAKGHRAVDTLVAGATHRSPRVRAACVALMDHLGDERCCDPLQLALRDASPLVRRHAVHSLGCQWCKVTPLRMDVVGALIERVFNDASARVRRAAVHQLGLQPYDPRTATALATVIAESRDPKLVSRARHGIVEQQKRADPQNGTASRQRCRSARKTGT